MSWHAFTKKMSLATHARADGQKKSNGQESPDYVATDQTRMSDSGGAATGNRAPSLSRT
jgi:hypothetical protein